MKEIYPRVDRAPYLFVPTAENQEKHPNRDKAGEGNEGDDNEERNQSSAADTMLERVSSFNILLSPRSSSSPRKENATKNRKLSESSQQLNQSMSDPDKSEAQDSKILPTWRLKDRMKTMGVGLIMALNVGTDPPDLTKPHPCATLQCWMDPSSVSRAKARETIGERLEAQYEKWQQQRAARPVKVRRAMDPTVDDVRALCMGLRRQAKAERVLLHYNGHGVPRPTANGEIWVFDKNHTQYIPLSVTDLRQWLGKPSMIVLDCSNAGILFPFLATPLGAATNGDEVTNPMTGLPSPLPSSSHLSQDSMEAAASQWVRDTIVLAPTSENEWLPMHPDYPADIFTSCLTTPIKMALRWFVRQNRASMAGLHPDAVDAIPGKANDRKTPLGELNWMFTAVTDSIAWNVLPTPLFQRLFRQDLLVASMFRNFLLADRILRSLQCSPRSYPPLPPGVCDHPLWQAWDLSCETCLTNLMRDGILGNHVLTATNTNQDSSATEDEPRVGQTLPIPQPKNLPPPTTTTVTSPFFSEQLTAFEIWLEFASIHHHKGRNKKDYQEGTAFESPEQLPVVLQVLLFQAHRVRALTLLRQFLDLGPWAVNLALSLGIFPYVLKLLQSPEYKQNLISIWAKILAFDRSCQVDLVKDKVLPHFIHHLTWGLNRATMHLATEEAAEQRALAAFILTATCRDYPQGQEECMRQSLHRTINALLSSVDFAPGEELDPGFEAKKAAAEQRIPPKFRLWLCLCVSQMVKGNIAVQNEAFAAALHQTLFQRLRDSSPTVRAAAIFALSCFLVTPPASLQGAPTQPLGLQPVVIQAAPNPQHGLIPVQHGMIAQTGHIVPQPTQMHHQAGSQNGFPGPLQPNFVGQPGMLPPAHHWPPPQGHLPTPLAPSPFYNPGQPAAPIGGPMPPRINFMAPPVASSGPNGTTVANDDVQPMILPSPFPHALPVDHFQTPSIYSDRSRLQLELDIVETIARLAKDASSMVRFEVVVLLGQMVSKYLDAFVGVAGEMMTQTRNGMDNDDERKKKKSRPKYPPELTNELIDRFTQIWSILRKIQHKDPHPQVAAAGNSVASYVNAKMLHATLEEEHGLPIPTSKAQQKGVPQRIDENEDLSRSEHDHSLPPPRNGGPSTYRPSSTQSKSMRRVASESMDRNRRTSGSLGNTKDLLVRNSDPSEDYELPESRLLLWQHNTFDNERKGVTADEDFLGPVAASTAYRVRRNEMAAEMSNILSEQYANLAPKPEKALFRKLSPDVMTDDEIAAANKSEQELAFAKNTLGLKQDMLLRNNDGVRNCLLKFHSFEDFLVACNDDSSVHAWRTTNGTKLKSFMNGNNKNTRITSSCWLNEASRSLLALGCDDGTLRVWDLEQESSGETSDPDLAASFCALNMRSGARESGLILEWQEHSNKLFAAGNSDVLRTWDLETEACLSAHETETDACVTTLTSSWDGMMPLPSQNSSSPIGPDTIVAGFSDGSIRMFDLRTRRVVTNLNQMRERKLMHYREHDSWIVEATLTHYGGQGSHHHELVTGSTSGTVKVWDLRVSASLVSYKVQSSPMTALAVHPKVPLVATGSHAQFIKLFTMDGLTLQVIRYHEEVKGQRVGPVSSLAFHPHKMQLASSGTDSLVSIYSPKATTSQFER